MDPKQIQKILIPATAIAAVILMVAVILGAFNTGSTPDSGSGTGKPGKVTPKGLIPAGADTSADGMSNDKPPADGADWREMPGGLKVWDVKEGAGEPIGRGQTVAMHYTGWLLDGTLFETSRNTQPLEHPLGRLVKGWQEGIPGMKVGGIRRLYIPWQMAYGEGGSPPKIPPKADLIFEVKLLAFQ
jgi:FKBP-type peptidyl-prolyl cis-trans isomerase